MTRGITFASVLFLLLLSMYYAATRTVERKELACGYLNASGSWLIPPQYERASAWVDGVAAVKSGKEWLVIQQDGSELASSSCKLRVLSRRFFVRNCRDNEPEVVSLQATELVRHRLPGDWKVERIDIAQSGSALIHGTYQGNLSTMLMETDGSLRFKPGIHFTDGFSEGLAIVSSRPWQVEGLALLSTPKCGYVNSNLDVVVPLLYEHCEPLSEGLSRVVWEDSNSGKLRAYYIGGDGSIKFQLKTPQSIRLGSLAKGNFAGGTAVVEDGSSKPASYFYIDREGVMISPNTYRLAELFTDGFAVARDAESCALLSTKFDILRRFRCDIAQVAEGGAIYGNVGRDVDHAGKYFIVDPDGTQRELEEIALMQLGSTRPWACILQ